jgi:hypothetical protein
MPLCARLTGIELGVKVSCRQGVANQSGPESCAAVRKYRREALTGEDVGRVLSRVTDSFGMPTS